MLSESLKQDIAAPVSASRLDPALKAYLAPLLEPKPTSTVTDRDRMEDGSVTLSAPSASGQNLSYQWKRNSTPILGATSKDLVIDDLNATLHSGNYKALWYPMTLAVFPAACTEYIRGYSGTNGCGR